MKQRLSLAVGFQRTEDPAPTVLLTERVACYSNGQVSIEGLAGHLSRNKESHISTKGFDKVKGTTNENALHFLN